jgi:heme A synthase
VSSWILIIMIIVALMILLGLILILIVWRKRKEKEYKEIDYRAFFMMGTAFLPIGMASMIVFSQLDISFIPGLPLFLLGLVYFVIGLANRDKWKKTAGEDEQQ